MTTKEESDKRRIEIIRRQSAQGDPYEQCFTRYAARFLLEQYDAALKEAEKLRTILREYEIDSIVENLLARDEE